MTNERSVSEVSAAASGGTPVKYNQNFIINIYNQYFKLTILSFRQCLTAFTTLKLRSFGVTSQFFANASKLFVRNWFDCIFLLEFRPFIIGTSREILYKIRQKCNYYKSVKSIFDLFYIVKMRVKKSNN